MKSLTLCLSLALTTAVAAFVGQTARALDAELETGNGGVLNNTYSVGYRMGRLDDYGNYGYFGFRTKTGSVFLGYDSVASRQIEGQKSLSPWFFSTDLGGALDEELERLQGNYVVIKYRQLHFNNYSLNKYSTDYRVLSVSKVDQTLQPKACETKNPGGWKTDKATVGRIVKISSKGTANKTFESIIQKGASGAEFREVSIGNEEMARCAYRWLASGLKAKITINQSYIYIHAFQESALELVKIEGVATNDLER